jgi:hypothetical protein
LARSAPPWFHAALRARAHLAVVVLRQLSHQLGRHAPRAGRCARAAAAAAAWDGGTAGVSDSGTASGRDA